MYPGKVVESLSWTFFPSAPELISCLQNASSGHLVQTYTLHSMLLLFLPPYKKNGYSCIARCLQNRVNSSLNQLGKTLNIGSQPCGGKVYPGCTSIHCIGEGRPIVLEGIRGSWLKSIFDDQLRLPAVETTIAWKCPKKPFRWCPNLHWKGSKNLSLFLAAHQQNFFFWGWLMIHISCIKCWYYLPKDLQITPSRWNNYRMEMPKWAFLPVAGNLSSFEPSGCLDNAHPKVVKISSWKILVHKLQKFSKFLERWSSEGRKH